MRIVMKFLLYRLAAAHWHLQYKCHGNEIAEDYSDIPFAADARCQHLPVDECGFYGVHDTHRTVIADIMQLVQAVKVQ